MLTRSKGNKEQLQFIPEIEAFARKLSSSTRRSKTTREEVDSSFSTSLSDLEDISMAESYGNNCGNNGRMNNNNLPPRRERLGDYVLPQGPRNPGPIVLSPEAQALDIKSYWFTFVQSNQFSGKSHEDVHKFLDTFYGLVRTIPLNLGKCIHEVVSHSPHR